MKTNEHPQGLHKPRGRGDFEATYQPHKDGVELRLDDNDAPEFWAQVWIPLAQLRRMVHECDAAAAADPAPF